MNVRVNMGCDVWSLIVVIAIALFGGIRAEGSMFTECPRNESDTNCSSTALNSCNRSEFIGIRCIQLIATSFQLTF